MKLDFRIDWGYQYLYSRRHYHPTYIWNGSLTCKNGEILETYQLTYPVIWFGPGQSAREEKLAGPEWKNTTKRRLAGVRFVAEVSENAEFTLTTAMGTWQFTAADIMEKGHISWLVGPKYQGCYVNVIKTGYFWFQPKEENQKTVFTAQELGLEVHNWARMMIGWVKPGECAEFPYTVTDMEQDCEETLIHLEAMAVPEFDPEKETQVQGDLYLEVYCDGKLVKTSKKYFRPHDKQMQILEDEWIRIRVPSGEHVFGVKNVTSKLCLGISRIKISQHGYRHGQLSVPQWALQGEKLTGKVFAAYEDTIRVSADSFCTDVACVPGWNEFFFTAQAEAAADAACGQMKIVTAVSEAEVEVYDCQEEKYPVKVGYDMTVVPHDADGFMDWLLDYTQRTRLGNYVVFRDFRMEYDGVAVDAKLMRKWGEFCREHGIYVSAATDYMNGELIAGAGDMFNDCGQHELPGKVYALDPAEPYASQDMKEASEKYTQFLKDALDEIHTVSDCAAFGDASGGIRYSFLAGADFVRAETMVGHTQTLLSQARPAAEALGKGRWGVHIAIQHGYQPYKETHLGQYFLSLMQPWMMGAEVIYEEDSLFELFKEERQAWDDCLTKGKRDMTRSFYKFAKTHPRTGKNVRSIAFWEGRYAAPFSGFICDVDQDPHYAVWGLFGKNAPEWGHEQPEKCRQLLDVLMPGASTHPLRQKFDRRRFYFSGTPYGDFDCVPAEADQGYLDQYGLLLNLGWNTMIEEDYKKLTEYVEQGGVLLTGLMQFSAHTDRAFLQEIKNAVPDSGDGLAGAALWNNGDLSKLCGIVVKGCGSKYSGQWNCADRCAVAEPQLSALHSDDVSEDGIPCLADVELAGAQVAAWDAATGLPMLVKKQVGKGFVYTFTLWAYPGHEQFMQFAAAWVCELAKQGRGDIYVEDMTGEVFWTRWKDENTERIMLLNTDWADKGCLRTADLVCGEKTWSIAVPERTAVIADIVNGEVTVKEYTL